MPFASLCFACPSYSLRRKETAIRKALAQNKPVFKGPGPILGVSPHVKIPRQAIKVESDEKDRTPYIGDRSTWPGEELADNRCGATCNQAPVIALQRSFYNKMTFIQRHYRISTDISGNGTFGSVAH
jgi:hypothetical protein